MMIDGNIVLLLSLWFLRGNSIVSLKQDEPPDERPVCPGKELKYICYAVSPSMGWREDDKGLTLSITDSAAEYIDRFKFEVIMSNQSTIVTSATLPKARPYDEGIRVECLDEGETLTEIVEVAREPESCIGSVMCYFSQDKLVVSLETPFELICVERFLFYFDTQNKTSDAGQNLAIFDMGETRGSMFENQSVYTLDDEGRAGPHPCPYNILAPDAVERVFFLPQTNGTNIDLHIIIERPTFPIMSCLSPENVTWNYNISTNITVPGFMVAEDEMVFHNVQAGTYEISVMPTAVEASLSATEFYSTTIVVQEVPTITRTHVETETVTVFRTTSTPVYTSNVEGQSDAAVDVAVTVCTILFAIGLTLAVAWLMIFCIHWKNRKSKDKAALAQSKKKECDPDSKIVRKETECDSDEPVKSENTIL